MKNPFLPCNLKYLSVACKRSNSDVGALIKGLNVYFTEGRKQTFDSEGMQMLYDLFVDDLKDFLANKQKLSETNANNARSKDNDVTPKKKSQQKKVNVPIKENDLAVANVYDRSDRNEKSLNTSEATIPPKEQAKELDESPYRGADLFGNPINCPAEKHQKSSEDTSQLF